MFALRRARTINVMPRIWRICSVGRLPEAWIAPPAPGSCALGRLGRSWSGCDVSEESDPRGAGRRRCPGADEHLFGLGGRHCWPTALRWSPLPAPPCRVPRSTPRLPLSPSLRAPRAPPRPPPAPPCPHPHPPPPRPHHTPPQHHRPLVLGRAPHVSPRSGNPTPPPPPARPTTPTPRHHIPDLPAGGSVSGSGVKDYGADPPRALLTPLYLRTHRRSMRFLAKIVDDTTKQFSHGGIHRYVKTLR